jgi:hypothetical protein
MEIEETMKFYIWFNLTDTKGNFPRITNEVDFAKFPRDSIRVATANEIANVSFVFPIVA